MSPLGRRPQERLRSPEPRARRASASAYASNNERAHAVGSPTSTVNRDPQSRVRPVSVPLFKSSPDSYASTEGSKKTVSRGLAHRSSDATSLPCSSSDVKTGPFAPDGHPNEVKDRHDGTTIAKLAAEKRAQKKDFSLKQQYIQSNFGTFAAIVLAQRWLGKLRLQNPHPITSELQQASEISYHQRRFIPESRIRDIVRDEVIQAELSKSNKPMYKPSRMMRAPVVAKDYALYRKILAILYLMKRPSKIRLFVKSGVCDKHLPLKEIQHPVGHNRSVTLTSLNIPESPRMEFKRPEDADEFLQRQWSVLAPVFVGSDKAVPHDNLEHEMILPFLSETTIAKEGGSSKVFKAKIHPDHHRLSQKDAGSNIYAIKVLKSKDDKAFNQEVTVLRKLSTSKHTHVHLITLLATYKYHAAYHLIFPWADADLFDYWNQSEEAPPEDGQMGTWMIEQCRGLASGLNSIHRYATFSGTSILDAFTLPSGPETEEQCRATRTEDVKVNQSIRNLFGRHGDLKPQNILWYPDSRTTGGHGILKITDFGVTRFNTENMWDTQKTGKLPNSPTYRSPENDLDGKLTTACDVWALGCVYLEFVTWYFGGSRLIKEHGTSRLAPDPRMANMRTDTFFTIYEVAGRKRARVKPAVLKAIEQLREHKRCDKGFSDFLDMIRDDMLVTHPHDVLESEDESPALRKYASEPVGIPRLGSVRRKSCGDVFRRLGDIKPRSDQEDDPTFLNTHETSTLLYRSHRTWPQREESIDGALSSHTSPSES